MVELRVLGALRLTASDRRDVGSLERQARRAALLVYLAAATPRGSHRRDKLLALFWPELDEARARAALNQAVYVLRATLGEDAIVPRGDGALGVTDAVWCDAAAFEAALNSGNVPEALALYRGDLLDGFFVTGAPEFERWLDGERERLRQRASEAAWALAETRAAEGDAVEAERWARRAVDLAPADEAGVRRLMTFLRGLGDRAAAVRAYETFIARLRQEYELEPSAETQALAASIRQEEQRAPTLRPVERAFRSLPAVLVPVRRRPPLWWVAASVVVATALAAGAGAWLGYRAPSLRPIVRFTLEFPANQQMATAVSGSTIALSPDGSHLAYLVRGPQGTQLFLRSLDEVAAVPIPHTLGASLPFFAPDGVWLGFVMGNTIRKVSLRGGPVITVCTVATNVSGASWGPNEGMVFATPTGLWRVSASGGDGSLLAASDTARGERYLWPEILPSGRAAVFTRVDDTGFQLAAVSLETGAVRPLGFEGTSPRFTTRGYLLFARRDGALLAAPFDPLAVRVTGPALPITDEVQVGIAGAAKLGVSGAGTLAYVPRAAADRTLATVDRVGNAETVPVAPRGYIMARFSPDGRSITTAIEPPGGEQPDIWVLDPTANTSRRVTFDSVSLDPVWSPDGGRVAFASKSGGRPGWEVRWVRADGSDSAGLLLPNELGGNSIDYTPDGRALVFQRRHPLTGLDLWMLRLDGARRPQPYLRGSSDEHSAAVSPDGQWLAYVSNESGRDEVYVRAFPKPGVPVQISSGGGREPRWAPRGRELFYRNEQGMVAAAVATSPSFRVGGRKVLFDDKAYLSHPVGAAYDVHPDGRRFLMIRRGSEGPQVVVVLNWFAQLRAVSARGTKSP